MTSSGLIVCRPQTQIDHPGVCGYVYSHDNVSSNVQSHQLRNIYTIERARWYVAGKENRQFGNLNHHAYDKAWLKVYHHCLPVNVRSSNLSGDLICLLFQQLAGMDISH